MMRVDRHLGVLVVFVVVTAAGPLRAQCVDTEVQKLTASDGEPRDLFASSVAVRGDILVAGAAHDPTRGPESGSAFVFRKEADAWLEQARIVGSDTGPNDKFGSAVSVDGSVILVGASRYRFSIGSAYVFRDGPAGWSQEQQLLASDGTFNRFFGASVSVSGNFAVVTSWLGGAAPWGSGAAYVFRYDGSSWNEQIKLVPRDAQEGDQFGTDVAVDGNVLVVGAPGEPGVSAGAAYVFRTDGLTWVQEQKLVASDGELDDFFGRFVAVSGDTIVVGASGDDDRAPGAGAAYVFRNEGSTWIEEQKLLAAEGDVHDSFGTGVAIDGHRIVTGAYLEDGEGMFRGAAYTFRRVDGVWSQEQRLVASDADDFAVLGSDVAVSGATVVASSADDERGADAGAAYVFEGVERRCGFGSVNLGASPFSTDVLLVNGSAGNCATRMVSASVGEPLGITMEAPPSGPHPARFVLYAWMEGPAGWTENPQPYGLGSTCFPTFISVGIPKPVLIWNNVGRDARLGTPDFPSQPAPSVVVSDPIGAPRALTLTLQGIIEDTASAATVPASLTNAIVLDIVESP